MIQVTITSKRQLAGIAAAAAASTEEAPVTPEQYLQRVVEAAAESYRDHFAVDRITSSDFILRLAPEFAAITAAAATDEVIAGFITRVRSEAFVWLASDEVQQGAAYLVAANLLTQQRADEVLAY